MLLLIEAHNELNFSMNTLSNHYKIYNPKQSAWAQVGANPRIIKRQVISEVKI